MKRISFFLALTLVIFAFGLAGAQTPYHAVQIRSIDGSYQGSLTGGELVLKAGFDIQYNLAVINANSPGCFWSIGNGMKIYSDDGATWSTSNPDTAVFIAPTSSWLAFNWTKKFPLMKADGNSPDTVGYATVTFGDPDGLVGEYDDIAWTISFHTNAADDGKHICIDTFGQGSAAPSGFQWFWSALGLECAETDDSPIPEWLGPDGTGLPLGGLCLQVFLLPDTPPEFDVPPTQASLTGSHCATLTATFQAHDPDNTNPGEPQPVTYSIVDGPGTIDPNTGAYSVTGSIDDVYESRSVTVRACEPDDACTDYVMDLVFTNQAPAFSKGCNDPSKPYFAQVDALTEIPFEATDNCPGDPKTFFVVDDDDAVGTSAFVGNVLQYTATGDDLGDHTWTVGVTDGKDTSTCDVYFRVTESSRFVVEIEKREMVYQGRFERVNVLLTGQDPDFGGFNFLLAYDASALTFQGADVDSSALYQECGWEYFTYRYGPFGNCGNACPSGMVRVVGIAETNNGAAHPTCAEVGDNDVLFSLNFLVSNDRNLECSYVPIRFYWIECDDNSISNGDGTVLYISKTVADFDYGNTGNQWKPEELEFSLPSFLGAPNDCVTSLKVAVIRDIDFYNGGIDIACADSIDARGDINLNGLPYEIADAVMFTNYFISGIFAFGDYAEGSIAASDVNADGIALSVADLVYLIRVIVGDAVPYPKLSPVAAQYTIDNNVIGMDLDLGGAYVQIVGNVTPQLLADNMEMKFAYNAETNVTSALVYSLEGNSFSGQFLDANGPVQSLEVATAQGAPVTLKLLPSDFALMQNYPNPFNPTTTIAFALPQASDYILTVYNVTGQIVQQFSGHGEAGTVTVEWNASNQASGVYFYKLNAGNFSATKKMVLLK